MTTPATRETTPRARPVERADGVELTLDPVALEQFLSDYWDRRPLLLQRAEAGRFDDVLAERDVHHLIESTGIRTPAFRLVKDGEQLPPHGYTQDIPWRPGSFSGTAVVERVASEFAAGATIVLQGLHLHWPAAATYCRALEMAFACPVQANAYYTPAASRGFDLHHDTHDVFVLQVSGTKRWRWHEPVVELPLKTQKWPGEHADAGEPAAEVTLKPGDTLYLPRGWPHQAFTSDVHSLHLTIGLHPATRLDALRAALDECGDDLEFRRALGADGTLPPALLDALSARLRPEAVARRMRRRFVLGRRPISEGQLAQVANLERLTVTDLVERRLTVLVDLEFDGDRPVLVFEGKEVAFPPVACEAVVDIHGRDAPFTPAELRGALDDAGRLVLVKRLIREGLLRAAASATETSPA
ncbi:MAG TPA: cupin domain-containing protein [Solirubrobacterales bacterium]|nr:cupin domain-containing protein [Solirubrobacterales bacterium]